MISQNECSSFPKRQILNSSKLKDFADDNFKFDYNYRQLSKGGRKHSGKRRNCSLRAISPIPTVFSKRLVLQIRKDNGFFGKGLMPYVKDINSC